MTAALKHPSFSFLHEKVHENDSEKLISLATWTLYLLFLAAGIFSPALIAEMQKLDD